MSLGGNGETSRSRPKIDLVTRADLAYWAFRRAFRRAVLRGLAGWSAGIVLVALGIASLYLSYAVVHGWWQGTTQAMGVGFFVGGVVDVLAIAGLGRVFRARDLTRDKDN